MKRSKILKIFLTTMLLPLALPVQAQDDPNNPGDDNPGTTYITRDYAIGTIMSGESACSVATDTLCGRFLRLSAGRTAERQEKGC